MKMAFEDHQKGAFLHMEKSYESLSPEDKRIYDEYTQYWEDEKRKDKRNAEEKRNALNKQRKQSAEKTREYEEQLHTVGNQKHDYLKTFREKFNPEPKYLSTNKSKEEIIEILKVALQSLVGDSIIFSDEINKVIDMTGLWMANTEHRYRSGLLITGNVGVGKTTMLRALQRYYSVIESTTLRIVNARDIITANEYDFATYSNENYLAIDDLGVEPAEIKNYGNSCTPMVNLITARYEKKQPTLITTNLTSEEIRTKYGERVFDRLREMCNKLSYSSEIRSFRGGNN